MSGRLYGLHGGHPCVIDLKKKYLTYIEPCVALDGLILLGKIAGNYAVCLDPTLLEPEQLVTHCLRTAQMTVNLYVYPLKLFFSRLNQENLYNKYLGLLQSTPINFTFIETYKGPDESFILLTPEMAGICSEMAEEIQVTQNNIVNFHLKLGNGRPFAVFDKENRCVYQLSGSREASSCVFSAETFFTRAFNGYGALFKEISSCIKNLLIKQQKPKQMDDLYSQDSAQLGQGNKIIVFDCIDLSFVQKKANYFENINVFVKVLGKLYIYVEQNQKFLFGPLTIEYGQMELLLYSFLTNEQQQIMVVKGDKCCFGYFNNGSSWLTVRQFLQSQCQIQLVFIEDIIK